MSSLVATTRRAEPKSSIVTESSLRPISSLMTVPPVRIGDVAEHLLAAIAEARRLDGEDLRRCRGACSRRAWRAPHRRRPRLMISVGLPCWTAFSSAGSMSWTLEIFLSVMRMSGLSRTASMRSGLVTKYAEM